MVVHVSLGVVGLTCTVRLADCGLDAARNVTINPCAACFPALTFRLIGDWGRGGPNTTTMVPWFPADRDVSLGTRDLIGWNLSQRTANQMNRFKPLFKYESLKRLV